jgi:hypothetical protein
MEKMRNMMKNMMRKREMKMKRQENQVMET